MSFTINEEKAYPFANATVFQAALGAVDGLQGKVAKQDAAAGTFTATFPKTIHGKVLGDRTEFIVAVNGDSAHSKVVVEAYPLDPVGRKLMFGARKGVTRTVLDWFWAHVEHRLPQAA